MNGAGAGTEQGSPGPAVPAAPGAAAPRPGSDWAGLPEDLLMKVAGKLVAQSEAAQAAYLKQVGWSEENIQAVMARRKRDGNCLSVFARVCELSADDVASRSTARSELPARDRISHGISPSRAGLD